jgi:hypothetical protein
VTRRVAKGGTRTKRKIRHANAPGDRHVHRFVCCTESLIQPTYGEETRHLHPRRGWDPAVQRWHSLILRKLGAYPRQNSLALALRELGRLERTLFTLQWLQSPELRQRVQLGLNKGEAKNALARAVFFNRLGELRDRSFENQRYRASGLNLVVAAIVLWNTVYLGRAIHGLREQGQLVDENLLAHLSPLGWFLASIL